VLVAPLSSSTNRRTDFCVKVPANEGNVSRKTWVRVVAVQPLAKADLQDHFGTLPPARMEEIEANLLRYMELID
jgi:mRNA-degrading endonuclease toxin of MazEF toxin-antitoxin module